MKEKDDVDASLKVGNLLDGTQRVQAPPGKGWPPARSESCVGCTAREPAKRRQRGRRPRERASKCTSRRGRPRSGKKGRQYPSAAMAWCEGSAGVKERGIRLRVPPGTWEALPSPPKRMPVRVPADQRSRSAAEDDRQPRERSTVVQAVPPGERNEPGGKGGGESESLRSTAEAGEPSRWDPAEGRRAPGHGTERGERCRDHRISEASQRDFDG